MAILGLRGTGDWGADERPKNFRETILWRQPNGQSPLTALLSRASTHSTDDPEFAWWEEQLDATILTLNTAIAANNTTAFVVMGDADNVVPGDLLLVQDTDVLLFDNEIVRVTAYTNATSITVQRGYAGSTARTTIATGTKLLKIGSAFAEGSAAPNATTRNPTKLRNYAQIFKTSYEITNTATKTNSRTGDPLKNDKKRKMFDHAVAMELAFLFGKPSEIMGSNGKPERTTGGLRSFIKTNNWIAANPAACTEDNFIAAVSPVFNYASGAGDTRLILCGNQFINKLNAVAKAGGNNRINFDGMIKVYGMNLQRWILPQGELLLKTHPLMNLNPMYNSSAFVLDPSSIRYRPLRDTDFEDNIQTPGQDGVKGQWITEAGLEVNNENCMAYIGNFK